MYALQFLFRYKSGTSKLTKYHHHHYHPTPLRPSLFVTFSVCAFSINTVELIVRSNCFCFLLILFLYASDSMEIWLWIVWFIFMICYIYLAKLSIFCITFHTLSRLTYPHLLKFLRIFFRRLLFFCRIFILSLWFSIFATVHCVFFHFQILLVGNLVVFVVVNTSFYRIGFDKWAFGS